jgi:hypothetical protein
MLAAAAGGVEYVREDGVGKHGSVLGSLRSGDAEEGLWCGE